MSITRIVAICLAAALGMMCRARAATTQPAEESKHLHADTRSNYVHRISIYDEAGKMIRAADAKGRPYSPAVTCGKCHEYDQISRGWHFNAASAKSHGRPGEPWILTDATTRTQIPLSYRSWPGLMRPGEAGLSDWDFLVNFARHLPGGGVGEMPEAPKDRRRVVGKLEIDCMACHTGDGSYDASERARQMPLQNFRWAPTVAAGLGLIHGTPAGKLLPDDWDPKLADDPDADQKPAPTIKYNKAKFDPEDHVTFAVTRRIPPERCYFCHTTTPGPVVARGRWHGDQDVHLTAGLTCVDCHRHGLDHAITRGYEKEAGERGDPTLASLTCRGCHLGVDGAAAAPVALGGRLGAPKPLHLGLPSIHLEKLSCTACHSGPWPGAKPELVHTALAHALGFTSYTRNVNSPPGIVQPIFLRLDGQITPHKAIWPNYWGYLADQKVVPASPDEVRKLAGTALPPVREGLAEGATPLSPERIVKVLAAMAGNKGRKGQPVYVSGGRIHRLTPDGVLASADHPAAAPYAWPLAHDVRPASQSLGIRGCADCHSTDAPIYFATVTPPGPADPAKAAVKAMHEMRGEGKTIPWLFAVSFIFRPMLKIISFGAVAVVLAVLALYGLRGLGELMAASRRPATAGASAEETARGFGRLNALVYIVLAACSAALALTGLGTMFALASPMTGLTLMAHCTAAGGMAAMLALAALGLADRSRPNAAGRNGNAPALSCWAFWAMLVSGVVVVLSAVLPMTPIPTQEQQHLLYETHRFSSIAFVAAMVLHLLGLMKSRRA